MAGEEAQAGLFNAPIAAVTTYIRRTWEHSGDPIAVDAVRKLREQHHGRLESWTERELLRIE